MIRTLYFAVISAWESITNTATLYLSSIKYKPDYIKPRFKTFDIPDAKGGIELSYVKATKALKLGDQIVLESEDRTRYARHVLSQMGRRLECRKMGDGKGWKCWRTL